MTIDKSTIKAGDTIGGTHMGYRFGPVVVALRGAFGFETPDGSFTPLLLPSMIVTDHIPAVPPKPAWHDWPVVIVSNLQLVRRGWNDWEVLYGGKYAAGTWLTASQVSDLGTPRRVEMVVVPEEHDLTVYDASEIEDPSTGAAWTSTGARQYGARLIAASIEAEAGK